MIKTGIYTAKRNLKKPREPETENSKSPAGNPKNKAVPTWAGNHLHLNGHRRATNGPKLGHDDILGPRTGFYQ